MAVILGKAKDRLARHEGCDGVAGLHATGSFDFAQDDTIARIKHARAKVGLRRTPQLLGQQTRGLCRD